MPRGKTMPSKFIPDILRMHGEGISAEKIADWLLTDHQVQISPVAIRKRLAKIREERRPIVQAVIADKLSKTVGPDLDKIGLAIERALEDEVTARMSVEETQEVNGKNLEKHPAGSDSWARIMNVVSRSRNDLKSLIELRFKLVGALNEGKRDGDSAKARDELLAKVDALVAKARQKSEVLPASPVPSSNTIQ